MDMLLGQKAGPMSPEDLAAAYPWPVGRMWVRAMMVLTLDGASTRSGRAQRLDFLRR